MARAAAALAVALAVLVALVAPVAATHDTRSFTAEQQAFGPIASFGFEKGGSIYVSATYASSSSQAPVTFVMCSVSDLDDLLRVHGTIESLCAVNLTDSCEWAGQLNINHQVASFDGTAASEDYYDFMYLNCNSDSVDLEVAYQFINPGGEHLSTGQIPFKTMSLVFAILWGTLFLGWGVNRVRFRRLSNPLFRTLGYVPFMSAVQQVVATLYWRKLSSTGDEDLGLLLTMLALAALASTTLLAVLVVIAKGWHLTRRRLLDTEWRNIAVMSVVFLISFSTYEIFSGFFFLFLLILVYVLILRYLFASVSTNIRVLIFQLRFLREANPTVPEEWLLPARQLRATRVFRSALPVYIILDIMLHVWSLMALERSPWAESMLINGCTLAVALFLCVVFRLRRHSVYFRDTLNQPLMLSSRQEPLPVVLVRNPDTVDSAGRRKAQVALGFPQPRGDCEPATFSGALVAGPPSGAAATTASSGGRPVPTADPELGAAGGGQLNVDSGSLAPLLGGGAL